MTNHICFAPSARIYWPAIHVLVCRRRLRLNLGLGFGEAESRARFEGSHLARFRIEGIFPGLEHDYWPLSRRPFVKRIRLLRRPRECAISPYPRLYEDK